MLVGRIVRIQAITSIIIRAITHTTPSKFHLNNIIGLQFKEYKI